MNEIRVVPTANAGAILYLGGFCVWTDVLNEENQGGYEVENSSVQAMQL